MKKNLIVGGVVALGLASSAMAAGEPETGIVAVDAAIVVVAASVAAIGVLFGGGAALRGGSIVWSKVTKYFSKSL